MMRSSRGWLQALLATSLLVALGAASFRPGAEAPPALAALEASVDGIPAPLESWAELAHRPAAEKLDAALRILAEDKRVDAEPLLVIVKSAAPVDLGAYAEWTHAWRWPAGEYLTLVAARPAVLLKIASLPGVAALESGSPDIQRQIPQPVDEDQAYRYEAMDPAAMRARSAKAPTWAETEALLKSRAAAGRSAAGTQALDPAQPDGWFDIRKGHSAKEAWEMGFRGEGVRVAVMDTSVDFAHQDLQGTWAILPEGNPYAGWPQVYDPYSAYLFSIDYATKNNEDPDDDTANGRMGNSGIIELYQEAEVQAPAAEGEPATACFKPLVTQVVQVNGRNVGQKTLLDEDCAYKLPAELAGSTVRYGHHPDTYIASQGGVPDATPPIANEFAGVLSADMDGDGSYETVMVDLDLDHDFVNEKPTSKESPLSWRDLDGDAIADLSGGLLYYFSDGSLPIPGGYLWGVGTAEQAPAAGSYVAFHYDTGGHGTLCASNVVSQGRLGVPTGVDLSYRDLAPGEGPDGGMNPGMAPDARVIAVGSIYAGPLVVLQSSWRYAVLGHDPEHSGDEAQITSNSYGFSGDNDAGWDAYSREIDYYVREHNPSTTFLVSAGNGGPGYGSLVAPLPMTGMNIGASTQMGSTGWDSAYESGQITYGDIVPWSDAGPAAIGTTGVHVAADGAYAGGAVPINSISTNQSIPEGRRSGEFANQTWGGTSRSSPIAAGNLALIYDAFRQKHDRWPTWAEARKLTMGGARFNGYDGYRTGAGTLDAANSARMAAGMHGIVADPPEWTAGGYRGEKHPGFASILHPGDSEAAAISLANVGTADAKVTLSSGRLRMISSFEEDWTSKDVAEERPYNFNAPDYMAKVDYTKIPENTELMIVRANLPLAQLDLNVGPDDPDGNQTPDNFWRLGLFQHTDWDDDTLLFDDKDGDGIVDIVEDPDRQTGLDQSTNAIVWGESELDQGEYMRFSYLSGQTNTFVAMVHHPRERWSSGIYVGMWHQETNCQTDAETGVRTCRGRPAEVPNTSITMRYEFYAYEDWPWLSLNQESLTVPAGGEASLGVSMDLPADAPYGNFQGAIFADYARAEGDQRPEGPAAWEPEGLRTVIPVNVNVAAKSDWSAPITFGGPEGRQADAPYDNGAVRGAFQWGWRPESGDWRTFFLDAEKPAPATKLVLRTTWDDDIEGQTDIDTHVWAPAADRFSNAEHPANEAENWSDPAWYGPYDLQLAVESPSRLLGGGRWAYDTSSGRDEDWIVTDAVEGLSEVVLQNVLYSGLKFSVPFKTSLGSIQVTPDELVLSGDRCGLVEFTPQIDLPDFQVAGFGLSEARRFVDEPATQDDQNDPSSSAFKQDIDLTGPAARFDITLTSADETSGFDLDLFLLADLNGNGVFDFDPNAANNPEVIATSTTSTSNESISLGGFTPAGKYQVWVHGYSVPAQPAVFDLTIDVISGDAMKVQNLPTDVQPGGTYSFEVCADLDKLGDAEGPARGVAVFGPGGAPTLLQIPIRWTREPVILPGQVIHLPYLQNGADAEMP
jgi:hypothetical protein